MVAPQSRLHRGGGPISSLLSRVRTALAPQYGVEGELGAGGMARIYKGYDRSLDRPVAIKVLRPELATARGAERFLREARLLARLAHPNVVPVHQVGEAEGLFFYVMDFLAGETLRDRLARGPLPREEAAAVAIDVLGALEAAHAAGVVHRDIKPANVFLHEDRAVVGDFGVARVGAGDTLTRPGERPGTPAYMAPEQAAGEEATPRSDLYAVAALLYESLTGRRWSTAWDPARADWSGVPRRLVRTLARGLARAPEARWPDAAAFRAALRRAAGPRRGLAAAAAVAGAAAVGVAIATRLVGPGPLDAPPASAEAYDVALLPCATIPAADSLAGEDLARLAALGLDGLPMLRVVPFNAAARWWHLTRARDEVAPSEAARALRARRIVRCSVLRRERGASEVRLELVEEDGTSLPLRALRGPSIEEGFLLGDSIAIEVLRALLPERTVSRQALVTLSGHDVGAVRAFLAGEHAFLRNDRARAERAYLAAATADSTLVIARWRLADVRRWLSRPTGMDLRGLHALHADALPPLDRLLLEAALAPAGSAQFAAYEEALRLFPHDGYALLIYGDELFHRGPLWGVSLDSAHRVLVRATERDPLLAPAWEHRTLAEIRLGEREAARGSLARYRALAPPAAGLDLFHPRILELAYLERFAPDSARPLRERLFGGSDPEAGDVLALGTRFTIPYLDLPETQLALGRLLAEGAPEGTLRASGRAAAALALQALGRRAEALAMLEPDRAPDGGARVPEDAARALEAAEWRVLPAALGLVPVDGEAERGRLRLARIAAEAVEDGHRARAAWALSLLALGRGDAGAEPPAPHPSLSSPAAAPLALHLRAAEAAAAGDPDRGLELLEPLGAVGSEARSTFPFLRAATYLMRGRWHAAAGRHDRAEAAWMWSENSYLDGVPGERIQAGEVDGALRAHARLLRAEAALRSGRGEAACRLAGTVLDRWEGADPAWAPARSEAARIRSAACPSSRSAP